MNQFEAKIRDHLALNLDLIEKGLTIINSEYHLRNSFGTNGRIDILARDFFGNYVIIEIKRSEQAARQALHELFKYVSILHRQLGVAQTSIRAMLVSTVWDELAVPFSEFLEIAPCHTEGIRITANTEGQIISAVKFTPIALNAALSISQSQNIHLYERVEQRDENVRVVSDSLLKVGINDHVLFSVDHVGEDERVIYPHGIYVTFSSPFFLVSEEQQDALKQQLNWDDELDQPDENFLMAYCRDFFNHDTMEIGYPDKLRVMTDAWEVNVILRSGRFKSNEQLISNEQVIQLAMQTEGGSPHYLNCITSPKFVDRWNQLKNDSLLVAKGNSGWELAIPMILEEIAVRDPNAKVAVSIYNIANTHFALCKLCIGDIRYFPTVEIFSQESSGVIIYSSLVRWNKKIINISPDDFFRITCTDPMYWLTAQHFGSQFEFDDLVRERIGLETPFFQIDCPDSTESNTNELTFTEKISRKAIPGELGLGFKGFFSKNRAFFTQYRELVSNFAGALFE
ncbi:endonuclease NucS domain-containing protein [Duganella sp. Root1480D1]|uniref:endonuclease NucS domain-containing protein n=1 Tax=Duganella sp. Root1480D1 TaxID=1736471 RepID=UPI00070A3B4B|nr:endonuclease NucS domain-containing protein [Duganella sp. Root1480D1]KQZ28069.1 hypothetical protein ASD58_11525 [Duganella sp. Root1480D1]